MIKIGIVPKVLETYKNQFELSVEKNLLDLLKNKLKFNNVEILTHNSNINKYNVFISSGGNNIKKFSKDIISKRKDIIDTINISENSNRSRGISGVPFFIINNTYAVSGAQESEVFEKIFETCLLENKD